MHSKDILLILTFLLNIIILTMLIFKMKKGEKSEKYENIFANDSDALNFAYRDYYREKEADRRLADI